MKTLSNKRTPRTRAVATREAKSRFRRGSLEALLEEIASKIPKRELRRLPRDLSINVDHHLYGAPKK